MNNLRNKEPALIFSHIKMRYDLINKTYYINSNTRIKMLSDTCNIFIQVFIELYFTFQKHSKPFVAHSNGVLSKSIRKLYIHYSTILIDFSSFLFGHNLKIAKKNLLLSTQVSFISLQIKYYLCVHALDIFNTKESALQ